MANDNASELADTRLEALTTLLDETMREVPGSFGDREGELLRCLNELGRRWIERELQRMARQYGGEPSNWTVDKFSSAVSFPGWKELSEGKTWAIPPDYEPLPTARATTWLLTTGWGRHGKIGAFEVPGSKEEL